VNLLKNIISWELEFILNEKEWSFPLNDGHQLFLEKLNNKVFLVEKKIFGFFSTNSYAKKDTYGFIDNDNLAIKLTQGFSVLNTLLPNTFYFYGKIHANDNILKGSYRRYPLFRLPELILFNMFIIQMIVCTALFIYSAFFSDKVIMAGSFYFIVGGLLAIAIIFCENKILYYFSTNQRTTLYKILESLTAK
jgi:hypothetical protein